jgi:hypothetical protein
LDWEIEYADGSSASGTVGYNEVEIGNIKIPKQAVQLANSVRGDRLLKGSSDGVLGLAFPYLDSVQSRPVKTLLESMQKILLAHLFTINLSRESFFTFGFVDDATVAGRNIHWVDIDSRQGFWHFTSGYARVGDKLLKRLEGAADIVDSVSSFILTHPYIVWMIYRRIEGARYDPKQPGWLYPAGAEMPKISFSVGDEDTCMVDIEKHNMSHSEVEPGLIYGSNQENPAYEHGDGEFDIFGTPFLRQIYAIFDCEAERFGVVKHESGQPFAKETVDDISDGSIMNSEAIRDESVDGLIRSVTTGDSN